MTTPHVNNMKTPKLVFTTSMQKAFQKGYSGVLDKG